MLRRLAENLVCFLLRT